MLAHSSHPVRALQSELITVQQENRALREEVMILRSKLEVLRNLHELAISITAETDILSLLDRILQSALASIDAEAGSLLLLDDDTLELVFVVVHGEARRTLSGHRIPLSQGIAGWVAETGEPLVVPNVYTDPRFAPDTDSVSHYRTQSILCVPIVYFGRVKGVIQALNKSHSKPFDEADLALLGIVARLAGDAMEEAEKAAPIRTGPLRFEDDEAAEDFHTGD